MLHSSFCPRAFNQQVPDLLCLPYPHGGLTTVYELVRVQVHTKRLARLLLLLPSLLLLFRAVVSPGVDGGLKGGGFVWGEGVGGQSSGLAGADCSCLGNSALDSDAACLAYAAWPVILNHKDVRVSKGVVVGVRLCLAILLLHEKGSSVGR